MDNSYPEKSREEQLRGYAGGRRHIGVEGPTSERLDMSLFDRILRDRKGSDIFFLNEAFVASLAKKNE
jgi:hypothetical protein